jgi:hypothetical protein
MEKEGNRINRDSIPKIKERIILHKGSEIHRKTAHEKIVCI